MRRPGVRIEVARIEREAGEILDSQINARSTAGLIQPEIAEHAGAHAPAVTRAAKVKRGLAVRLSKPWPSRRFARADAYDD